MSPNSQKRSERHNPASMVNHDQEIKTNPDVGWAFLDQCIKKCSDGTLTPEEGAMTKLWTTENEGVVVDKCLQLFGGYGYMSEYPVSHMFVDARVRRIYGGAAEVMKRVIARSL